MQKAEKVFAGCHFCVSQQFDYSERSRLSDLLKANGAKVSSFPSSESTTHFVTKEWDKKAAVVKNGTVVSSLFVADCIDAGSLLSPSFSHLVLPSHLMDSGAGPEAAVVSLVEKATRTIASLQRGITVLQQRSKTGPMVDDLSAPYGYSSGLSLPKHNPMDFLNVGLKRDFSSILNVSEFELPAVLFQPLETIDFSSPTMLNFAKRHRANTSTSSFTSSSSSSSSPSSAGPVESSNDHMASFFKSMEAEREAEKRDLAREDRKRAKEKLERERIEKKRRRKLEVREAIRRNVEVQQDELFKEAASKKEAEKKARQEKLKDLTPEQIKELREQQTKEFFEKKQQIETEAIMEAKKKLFVGKLTFSDLEEQGLSPEGLAQAIDIRRNLIRSIFDNFGPVEKFKEQWDKNFIFVVFKNASTLSLCKTQLATFDQRKEICEKFVSVLEANNLSPLFAPKPNFYVREPVKEPSEAEVEAYNAIHKIKAREERPARAGVGAIRGRGAPPGRGGRDAPRAIRVPRSTGPDRSGVVVTARPVRGGFSQRGRGSF